MSSFLFDRGCNSSFRLNLSTFWNFAVFFIFIDKTIFFLFLTKIVILRKWRSVKEKKRKNINFRWTHMFIFCQQTCQKSHFLTLLFCFCSTVKNITPNSKTSYYTRWWWLFKREKWVKDSKMNLLLSLRFIISNLLI